MADSYVYLLSSLPSLQFGAKPPFSFAKLLELSQGLISDEDIEALKAFRAAELAGAAYEGDRQVLKAWYVFETALRNELVKIRASRKKIDQAKYLRREHCVECADPALTHLALAAHRNPSLLEGEKMLDAERWHEADELAIGHYFDFDSYFAYAQKLLILERWENIRAQDKHKLLEEVLTS